MGEPPSRPDSSLYNAVLGDAGRSWIQPAKVRSFIQVADLHICPRGRLWLLGCANHQEDSSDWLVTQINLSGTLDLRGAPSNMVNISTPAGGP